jgi:hypothetical protein
VVFLQNSLRNLAGNLRAEFDPEQGIRIPEQGIWRPPEIPAGETLWGAVPAAAPTDSHGLRQLPHPTKRDFHGQCLLRVSVAPLKCRPFTTTMSRRSAGVAGVSPTIDRRCVVHMSASELPEVSQRSRARAREVTTRTEMRGCNFLSDTRACASEGDISPRCTLSIISSRASRPPNN